MTTKEFKIICRWVADGECEFYTFNRWEAFPGSDYDLLVILEAFSSYRRVDPYAALKQAHKEGKVIQFKYKTKPDSWKDASTPMWDSLLDYRIKPYSPLRPWKPEEVPVGALIRGKYQLDTRTTILAVWFDVITIPLREKLSYLQLDEALGNWVHSLDHGKTWLPCGLMEEKE
jgi:hypothetical protein